MPREEWVKVQAECTLEQLAQFHLCDLLRDIDVKRKKGGVAEREQKRREKREGDEIVRMNEPSE